MRAVVFDLGGVLIDWNPRHLYRRLIPDAAAMERFLAEICTPEWNLRQDAGRSFDAGVAELVARHPDQAELIRAYRDRWSETVAGPIAGSVEILAEVRDRHRVLALTNWSAETFPIARAFGPRRAWPSSFLAVVSPLRRCPRPASSSASFVLFRRHPWSP